VASAGYSSVSLRGPGIGVGLFASVLLHVGLIAAFLTLRSRPVPTPPVYNIQLLAAPTGTPAIGVVQPAPAAPAAPARTTPAPPKAAPRTPVPAATSRARRVPKQVTETPPARAKPAPATAAPTAGSAAGGSGADAVTIDIENGMDFPYPAYLKNIENQIAIRFHPSSRGALKAVVQFLIRRDGSVPEESISIVTSSGVFTFNEEARGAIEAAAHDRAFGPLPAGFHVDVLPVNFHFDPSILH
jgi:outer membrane biosynthesis protein TonB